VIPAISTADRNKPEVTAYLQAPLPKAAALSDGGKIVFSSAARSQTEAETQALAKCGDGCFLYAVGNQVVLPQRLKQPRPLGDSLADVLAYALVSNPATWADSFRSFKPHKSMVFFPELRVAWNFTQFDTAEAAEQVGLEACGLKFNTICVTVAVDDDLKVKDPSTALRRPMPRLAYQGAYRPDMVPLYPSPPRIVLDYVNMPTPKAMAIGPQGLRITTETSATLAEAQAKALAKCTDPDSPYPCFIYAVNNDVILPQRRTEPTP
jgi:hypothetical protein